MEKRSGALVIAKALCVLRFFCSLFSLEYGESIDNKASQKMEKVASDETGSVNAGKLIFKIAEVAYFILLCVFIEVLGVGAS